MEPCRTPGPPGLRLVLVTYEFTYSPFSGNGILARSIAKALLRLGCQVTVLCCQPCDELQGQNSHLTTEELSEVHSLTVIPLKLAKSDGWFKLDDHSAWSQFVFDQIDEEGQCALERSLNAADAVVAVDWTGAHACQSLPSTSGKPLVYMNFRVYSSGVLDERRRQWFDEMERQALQRASLIVVLSQLDRMNLMKISDSAAGKFELLLPPLRGDMHELAHQAQEELDLFLPAEVKDAWRPEGSKRQRFLVTCVARISPEKNVFRFLRFLQMAKDTLHELGLIPLLAGSSSDESYAAAVKAELKRLVPGAIIVDTFLTPKSLAAVFGRTALNFHPCAYDAYGMTIVEAAACAAPSVLAGESVGAWALLGSHSLCVDMPPDENELSDEAAAAITNFLRDPEHELLGASARREALRWDEQAYGTRLLEFISSLSQSDH
ncbi:PCMTD1 [Symbiodinium necroappetens]|uniref:PCMTD1 protein n=1 Tax=Symbiodinium necroappetens TaxID=1628268 RepID=A0A813BQV0_9DINO|nr:PCMTD1 [Symbiodinium necroappetens]